MKLWAVNDRAEMSIMSKQELLHFIVNSKTFEFVQYCKTSYLWDNISILNYYVVFILGFVACMSLYDPIS